MHRWSPHCALGWLQAELEEAEQEAEVRGKEAGPGDRERDLFYHSPTSFLHCRLESVSSRKSVLSARPPGEATALLSSLYSRAPSSHLTNPQPSPPSTSSSPVNVSGHHRLGLLMSWDRLILSVLGWEHSARGVDGGWGEGTLASM